MQITPISQIILNKDNPRLIKDDKFRSLVRSIQSFPEMLEKRPIIVNKQMVVLGGNMRLRACIEAGMTEVPIIIADWTEAQQKEFIIKDNISGGEWDWDTLSSDWDMEALEDWGLDIPDFHRMPNEFTAPEDNKAPTMKITFESPEQLQHAERDIKELLDRKYPEAYFSVSAGEI